MFWKYLSKSYDKILIREFRLMINCDYCKRRVLKQFIISLFNLKSKDIQADLNISKSAVSRYMTGTRNSVIIDIYIIEKVFGIKIKEYSINK